MAGKKEVKKEEAPTQEAPKAVEAEVVQPAVVKAEPQNRGLAAPLGPEPEVLERVREAIETLESFNGISLPLVRFKDGFDFADGEGEIESFEGIIVFTKESNVFYKDRYKPGKVMRPDCFSPDGKVPTTENPVSPTCAACPNNQFGSAKEGDGKACKNTRPIFVVCFTPELDDNGKQQLASIPRVLRIPPTSLTLVKQHMVNLAASFGNAHGVVTRFEVFKKNDDQTHNNIRFAVARRLTPQEKANIVAIRNGFMPLMTTGFFGMDVEHEAGPSAPPPAPGAGDGPAF